MAYYGPAIQDKIKTNEEKKITGEANTDTKSLTRTNIHHPNQDEIRLSKSIPSSTTTVRIRVRV
jgi:hypothetical protein